MRLILTLIFVSMLVWGCKTVKPYEKEYLLNPLMDDAGVSSLKPEMANSTTGQFEKLSGSGGGGSATSCPTCGG